MLSDHDRAERERLAAAYGERLRQALAAIPDTPDTKEAKDKAVAWAWWLGLDDKARSEWLDATDDRDYLSAWRLHCGAQANTTH